MKRLNLHHPKLILSAVLVAFVTIAWAWFVFFDSIHNPAMKYGVTFDPEYAGSLQINPADAFDTIVGEWNFKYVRLPIHWDKVEPKKGEYDFSEISYYLGEAEKHNVKMILAIGNKTPRWPECHTPAWAKNLSRDEYMSELRDYMKITTDMFKDSPALEMWQVENEPFLAFGKCFLLSHEELNEEIALVKSIDSKHPILVGDSGELSTWYFTSKAADYFGTTLYRVVWNKYIGYWDYDFLPAVIYRWKMKLVGRSLEKAFVVELQAEPWSPSKPLAELSVKEQEISMSLPRLRKNIDFAQRIGVSRTYLWGSEWWYWLKTKGYHSIPDYIGTLNH